MRLRRRLAAVTAAAALALTSLGLSGTAEARPLGGRRRTSSSRCCRSTTSTATCSRPAAAPRGERSWVRNSTRAAHPVGGAEYLATKLTELRAKARYSRTSPTPWPPVT